MFSCWFIFWTTIFIIIYLFIIVFVFIFFIILYQLLLHLFFSLYIPKQITELFFSLISFIHRLLQLIEFLLHFTISSIILIQFSLCRIDPHKHFLFLGPYPINYLSKILLDIAILWLYLFFKLICVFLGVFAFFIFFIKFLESQTQILFKISDLFIRLLLLFLDFIEYTIQLISAILHIFLCFVLIII